MSTKQWLLNRLKKAFENTESTITSIIVLAVLGGSVGILSFSQKALSFFLQLLKTPTPLWATIALVFLAGICIYLKLHKPYPSTAPKPKTKYISIGRYKWKTKIYDNGHFEIDKYPYCIEHDLKFIHGRGGKYCPGTEKEKCNNKLPDHDEFKVYESAKSIIENKVRNNKY